MERKVPSTASEEIELYLRTIYSLLRSTTEVQIRTLEETHAGTNSSLHLGARSLTPDTSAFIYSLLRLPDCMPQVGSVILGQSSSVFIKHGYEDIEDWQEVSSRARRRRCYFNNRDILACYIASRSDIDDVVPTLTAYQIEWNKLNVLLQRCPPNLLSEEVETDPGLFDQLAKRLEMSVEDLDRLRIVWDDKFRANLKQIADHRCHLRIRLLSSSLNEYWRATRAWVDNIMQDFPLLSERPVYFISSNTHSAANLLTGFAFQRKDELIDFMQKEGDPTLLAEWNNLCCDPTHPSLGNFLYYLLKKYQATENGSYLIEAQHSAELASGIYRYPSTHSFDVDAQIIELNRVQPQILDPRISIDDALYMFGSNAIILNIDYPLGLSAYNILAKVTEIAGDVLGVYVMGKAASLNGVRGDVMIPNVVYDEHSQNSYLFHNSFSATDVAEYLVYGTVLDNQKAVSVLGTFLQNSTLMDVFYREGYTDIEMEAGPYLSAIYEMYRPQRHPINEIVNLYGVPFDVGILHYTSDTPLSKGKNLGAGTLSYQGMDATYATTVAILQRIFRQEHKRLNKI